MCQARRENDSQRKVEMCRVRGGSNKRKFYRVRHNVSFRRQTGRPEREDNATIGSVEGPGMSAASKSK